MSDSMPYVSVVIRCRNEAVTLREVLSALAHQKCSFAWELVLVDNESTDDTASLAISHGARVVNLPKAEFTYGRAINRGIEAARGELVLLLSAHSLPLSAHFLESAAAPFSDSRVAAARCMMVGNDQQLRRWYQPRDIYYASRADQSKAEEGHSWLSSYPTAGCCMLRRSVALEIKFDETLSSNEDKYWASCVLAAGYHIQCCADATWVYLRKRNRRQSRIAQVRQELALYRINGYVRRRLPDYLAGVLHTLVRTPLEVCAEMFDRIVRDTNSLCIPLWAKREDRSGSYSDFELRETGSQKVESPSTPDANQNAAHEGPAEQSLPGCESKASTTRSSPCAE